MEPVALDMKGICKTYWQGDAEIRALQNVNLHIAPGEFLAITGQSGSGKSTLMNILGCLDTPTEGSYRIGGREIGEMSPWELAVFRSRTIGFIFQNFCLVPDLDAQENVELPLLYQGLPRRERRERAREALERVGLGERLHHRPNQMSGGQQQRAAVAQALSARPGVILADAPTGNLDRLFGEAGMKILVELNNEGKTVILITHDDKIAKTSRRQVRICDGIVS